MPAGGPATITSARHEAFRSIADPNGHSAAAPIPTLFSSPRTIRSNLKLVQVPLQAAGCRFRCVENGAEALAGT